MNLETALEIQRGDVISFVGAGGKTSALFRLARELAAKEWRVVATTTTRVAVEELAGAPSALMVDESTDLRQVQDALDQHGFVFLYFDTRRDKAIGIPPGLVRKLLDRVNSDVLLVEADGARRLPLKAPYSHEPVIPPETTHVVVVAGLDALGQPLDEDHVYNPAAMIERYGFPEGGRIVWPWLASVLRDDLLGLRGIEPRMQVSVLLNKVPGEGTVRRRAQMAACLLLRSKRIRRVLIGAMQEANPVYEARRPVAAVVLAAGMSSRMDGALKVLLPWGRETVLETILRRLRLARLDDLYVITGREAERVGAAAAPFEARLVHNPDYATGEMLSSLQAGLRAIEDSHYAACLVVLGDQPQIQGRVIASVVTAYAEGWGSIIAPSYRMRRGHPILIDRRYWRALLGLPPGSAPRDVINAHANEIGYVNVDTDSILQDIDTPEDYRAALRQAGLA